MTRLPSPGPHGGDGEAVARSLGLAPADVLDLSQSLNPVAPDPVPVLARHLGSLRRYPDAGRATAALAAAMGVDERRLLLTNGGAEAIALVAEDWGGRVVEPEFSLHPRSGGPLWRSNPHNPSGRLARPDDHAEVWDEAFYALATGSWTRGDPDAVVVGSLTKILACPGLRIGYVLVPEGSVEMIDRCRRRQPEWSVNGLAVSALPDLLATVDLPTWSAHVRTLRADLIALLGDHGLHAAPSDANWVLVPAPQLRSRLATHGIVVRDCTSFHMPEMVRIAVPPPRGLERLEAALSVIDDAGRDRTETARSASSAPALLEPAPRKGAS